MDTENENKKNILLIMTDQHRHDYVGYLGNKWVDTPNLDRLARKGMVFTHCCTTSAVCAPTRISLATGLLPTRTGTTSNERGFMPISIHNHYKHFRDNGYRVELVGHHDLAKPGAPASIYGNRPLNFSYGFTRTLEVEGGMACSKDAEDGIATGPWSAFLKHHGYLEKYGRDYQERKKKDWIIGASHDSILPTHLHQDHFITSEAVKRIENIETDYPWYLFVTYQGPHDPFDPPKEIAEKYRNREMPPIIKSDHSQKAKRVNARSKSFEGHSEELMHTRRQYCASIEFLDMQIGRMLDALKKRGLMDNTFFLCSGDHREMLGDHGLYQKFVAYEAAMRVPLLIAGPGIPSGKSDALVELMDLNPTLVEYTGLPDQPNLDARSFYPVLMGLEEEHRQNCINFEDRIYYSYYAIRDKKYKYIITVNDMDELYDLEEDPDETKNIIDERPEVARRLYNEIYERVTEGQWNR